MTIIKDIGDLPPWFRREKYDGAKKFNASQWYEQLNRRRVLLDVFDYRLDRSCLMRDDGSPMYEFDLWRCLQAATLEAMRDCPLSTHYTPPEAPIRSVKTYDFMKQMDRDTIALREGLCGEARLQRWSVIADPEAHYGLNEEIADQLMTMDFYDPSRKPLALVQVDLGATNKDLKKAFDAWLKGAREADRANAQGQKSSKNDTIYSNWERYGLLPYLDLKIWMMETGHQITHQLLLRSLSKYAHSESNFEKTTITLADRLMSDLTQIKANAAVELANI